MKDVLAQVVKFGRELLSLKNQVEKNTTEIKEIRQDLHELSEAVRSLTNVVQRNHQNDAHEREKLELKLEIILLKHFRHVPANGENNLGLRSQNDTRLLPPEI
jgi:hypothetical protein